jgi:hypothetical protein
VKVKADAALQKHLVFLESKLCIFCIFSRSHTVTVVSHTTLQLFAGNWFLIHASYQPEGSCLPDWMDHWDTSARTAPSTVFVFGASCISVTCPFNTCQPEPISTDCTPTNPDYSNRWFISWCSLLELMDFVCFLFSPQQYSSNTMMSSFI